MKKILFIIVLLLIVSCAHQKKMKIKYLTKEQIERIVLDEDIMMTKCGVGSACPDSVRK